MQHEHFEDSTLHDQPKTLHLGVYHQGMKLEHQRPYQPVHFSKRRFCLEIHIVIHLFALLSNRSLLLKYLGLGIHVVCSVTFSSADLGYVMRISSCDYCVFERRQLRPCLQYLSDLSPIYLNFYRPYI